MAEETHHKHEDRRDEFKIQIDRTHYTVSQHALTGAELRRVPPSPIGDERDLFEVVPGGQDRKIEDTDRVEIHNGQRFFTAPAHINPGAETALEAADCNGHS